MWDLRMARNVCFICTWELLLFCANFEEKEFMQVSAVHVWKEESVSGSENWFSRPDNNVTYNGGKKETVWSLPLSKLLDFMEHEWKRRIIFLVENHWLSLAAQHVLDSVIGQSQSRPWKENVQRKGTGSECLGASKQRKGHLVVR